MVINRVTKMSETEFEEEQAAFIEPTADCPYPNGLHTLSAVGDKTVVDGKFHTFNKNAFKHALLRNLVKL